MHPGIGQVGFAASILRLLSILSPRFPSGFTPDLGAIRSRSARDIIIRYRLHFYQKGVEEQWVKGSLISAIIR